MQQEGGPREKAQAQGHTEPARRRQHERRRGRHSCSQEEQELGPLAPPHVRRSISSIRRCCSLPSRFCDSYTALLFSFRAQAHSYSYNRYSYSTCTCRASQERARALCHDALPLIFRARGLSCGMIEVSKSSPNRSSRCSPITLCQHISRAAYLSRLRCSPLVDTLCSWSFAFACRVHTIRARSRNSNL